MGHANTQTLGIPFASTDGKYYSRYPQGDKFGQFGDAQGLLVSVSATSPDGVAAESTGITNGSAFTVNISEKVSGTGTSFGTKTGTAPRVWDHGQSADGTLDAQWSDGWPNASANSFNNLKNRTTPFVNAGSGSTIQSPHQFTGKILGGCHAGANLSNGGNNVIPWVTYTRPAFPYYSRWSYYFKGDPAFRFSISPDPLSNDNNNKTFDFSEGGNPYESQNWYLSGFGGTHGDDIWSMNDDATTTIQQTSGVGDSNGHSNYWDDMDNAFGAQWIRTDIVIKWSNQIGGGFIKVYENGVLKVDYLGRTDNYSGTTRTQGLGGYNRNQGDPHQFRYFSDCYGDLIQSTPGAFFATNSAVFGQSVGGTVIIEPQPWNGAWTSAAVPLTANRGKHPAGPVHIHYRDEVNGHIYLGTRTFA